MTAYIIRRLFATLPVMAVVTIFVFFLLRLAPGDPAAIIAGDDATAAVPNVVGRTADEARSAVKDAGLSPSLQYEWSPSVADGTVIRTDPGAGTELDRGAEVHLVVSGTGDTGAQDQVTVPNVAGAPAATAPDIEISFVGTVSPDGVTTLSCVPSATSTR